MGVHPLHLPPAPSCHDADGNATGVRDGGLNVTEYLYDKLNRQTVTVDATLNRSTQLLDLAGRATGTQDGLGNTTQYLLDSLGRATVTIDADSKRTTAILDGNGNATQTRDVFNQLWEYHFDKLNRVSVTIDPYSQRTTTTFDQIDNATVVKDASQPGRECYQKLPTLRDVAHGANASVKSRCGGRPARRRAARGSPR